MHGSSPMFNKLLTTDDEVFNIKTNTGGEAYFKLSISDSYPLIIEPTWDFGSNIYINDLEELIEGLIILLEIAYKKSAEANCNSPYPTLESSFELMQDDYNAEIS